MRVVRKVLSGVIVAAGLCLAATMLLPMAFGYQRYVIVSGSMTGTYDQGSIVFDKTVPTSDLKVGEVITYSPPASSGETGLITHRIYSMSDHGKDGVTYRTKGDANPQPDPWRFQLDQPTQAEVAFSIPYLGYGIAALSMLPIRMIIIGLPALLIAFALIARMWREAGEEARVRNEEILARHAAAQQQPPVQPVAVQTQAVQAYQQPVQPVQAYQQPVQYREPVQPVTAAAPVQTPAPPSQGGALQS
jgi:signal peptidase I